MTSLAGGVVQAPNIEHIHLAGRRDGAAVQIGCQQRSPTVELEPCFGQGSHGNRREIGDGHWVMPDDVLMAGLGDENNPLGSA